MGSQNAQTTIQARGIFQDAVTLLPTFNATGDAKRHICSLMQSKIDSEYAFVIVNQDELTAEGIKSAIAYTRNHGLTRYIDTILAKYEAETLQKTFLEDIGLDKTTFAKQDPQGRAALLRAVLEKKLDDMGKNTCPHVLAKAAKEKTKELYGRDKIRRGIATIIDYFQDTSLPMFGRFHERGTFTRIFAALLPIAPAIVFKNPFIAVAGAAALHAAYGTSNTATWWHSTLLDCAPRLPKKDSLRQKINHCMAAPPEHTQDILANAHLPLVIVAKNMAYYTNETKKPVDYSFAAYTRGLLPCHPGTAGFAPREGLIHYSNSLSSHDEKEWQEAFSKDIKTFKGKKFFLQHSSQPLWWLLRPEHLIDEEVREELVRIHHKFEDKMGTKQALQTIKESLPALGKLFEKLLEKEIKAEAQALKELYTLKAAEFAKAVERERRRLPEGSHRYI